MDFFLSGPSSVLVVADSSAVRSDLTAAIDQREFSTPVTSAEVRHADGTDDEPVTARGVSTAEAATDAVAADGQIGCVVTTASLPDADVAEFVADVAERRPNLPVVVYPEDGDEQLASAVTCAGAEVYLPRADGTNRERVLDEIESALVECDRRRRNEAESDMFDYALRNLDINVYVKDGRGRHLKTADQPNSPTPEDVIGLTDPEVYGDEDAAAEATSDDRRVLDGHPIVRKVERWNDDTGDRWYRTTKIPWRVGGDVVGLVGVTKDITDRKRKAVALEEFADYVSHDLRSPLNVASGFVDMARDTGDVTALDQAESALQRMDQMIDDLTTLVRSNADRSTEVASSPIAPLVRDVWDVVGTDEATLELDVPEGSAITAEESQIRPLFENLLKNAIDHGGGASTRKADAFTRGGAETGGRASGNSDTDNSVTVRVGLLNDGFYVEDDGSGIPEDRRDDVFSEGYTTAKGGSGIGLAIVSEIAESRQWDVQLTESSDGGARFEFRNCLLVRDPALDADVGAPVDIETNADVGDPKLAGDTTAVDAERYTVEGGGKNVWQDVNEFQFAYAEVDGPVRVQAKVDTVDGPNPYSKAGVMIRESLDEDAPAGYVGETKSNQTESLWRTARDDLTRSQHIEGGALGTHWYRVDRVGDRLTCSVSDDGEEWQPIVDRRVELSDSAYAGLAVASVVSDEYCTATFSNVEIVELDA